ncbi:hypothetical protein LEP1GSC025_0287 [Leptospira interrogans str. 2002000621]|nr:hypothetical protein LEP1GSC025_0287 [Leptospira interrogans str. 2002000621]
MFYLNLKFDPRDSTFSFHDPKQRKSTSKPQIFRILGGRNLT